MTPTLTQTPSGWSVSLPHITMNGFKTKAKALRAIQFELDVMNFEGETIEDRLREIGL